MSTSQGFKKQPGLIQHNHMEPFSRQKHHGRNVVWSTHFMMRAISLCLAAAILSITLQAVSVARRQPALAESRFPIVEDEIQQSAAGGALKARSLVTPKEDEHQIIDPSEVNGSSSTPDSRGSPNGIHRRAVDFNALVQRGFQLRCNMKSQDRRQEDVSPFTTVADLTNAAWNVDQLNSPNSLPMDMQFALSNTLRALGFTDPATNPNVYRDVRINWGGQVRPQETPFLAAGYHTIFDPDQGIIIAINAVSPRSGIANSVARFTQLLTVNGGNAEAVTPLFGGEDPRTLTVPSPSHWSDVIAIAYNTLCTGTCNPQQIRGVLMWNIANVDTISVMNSALGMRQRDLLNTSPTDRIIFTGDGIAGFGLDQRGALALQASPNGAGVAYMLLNHVAIFGKKNVTEIHVFKSGTGSSGFPLLFFRIED
ncbi:hypothetical protein B0H63DRAFT_520662 [Podospora didyma]|uniref:Uncharacterized protein n=1 Tax=Podospora didyma TaxID=330526 RepID=A0AAE0U0N7_9PEZI|nr:hypothetical protein B0H63DRAFT_520662 [Podospora didyma]